MSCEVLVQGRNWDWRNKEAGPKKFLQHTNATVFTTI